MVKFAVCDDDRGIIDCISDKLRTYYRDECGITIYSDGARLLSEYRRGRFAALFLSVNAPGMNGMEIAERIREKDRRVKIIFVSSQNELAYKGYIYGAFRFVRKSNLDQDLCEAVASLKDILSLQEEFFIFRTDTGESVQIVENIKYFEANDHSVYMVCKDGIIRTHGTMRNCEERLRRYGFIRIHKSFLVNYRYIHSVDYNSVVLTCGKELPLSRNRISSTKAKMSFFKDIM